MDYDKATPGIKVYSWEDLYHAIHLIANKNYDYLLEMKNAHDLFNKYQDGKNSERVVKWVKTLE